MKFSLLPLAAALLFLSCGLAPPLVVTREGEGVRIGVETLGEYPTSISRIRLVDLVNQESVWELRAQGRVPQIWDFRLEPGINGVQPEVVFGGPYEVVVPASRQSFVLLKGRRYEISVWNKKGNRRAHTTFTL